jgi:hypothetical protein
MAGKTGPGMFSGAETRGGKEVQRLILILVNRLSLFLKTKRDVNRVIDAIRLMLKAKVKQRQNSQRIMTQRETDFTSGKARGG